ncbi:MAG: [protein-PII] uridylyltransferase [Gammaproteobacteria bacterium]|nr:[protein-PII] uridylyltransferase [Gammaproteobacteria bacterium]
MKNINGIDEFLDRARTTTGLQTKPIIEGIEQANLYIYAEFDRGVAIESLVKQKSRLIDKILSVVIEQFIPPQQKNCCCLVAVGGYGRSELLPGSDIDLMLLLQKKPSKQLEEHISAFLTFLWDIGLEVGHSVRTIKDCIREGKADVTVITNMIESRLLHGTESLYAEFEKAIAPRKMWSSRRFFEAKLEEQHNRHLRFNDTAYNLEPNIKEGPGGLRDIQIIGWVAKRHFGASSFSELVDHEFITEAEHQLLEKGQQHLWKVRFALHRQAKRREDRLLFDYQNQLATEFGFKAGKHNLAIEQFMQAYYRTIMELERLNEMLLQIFREEIILTERQKKTSVINNHFMLRNRYLAVRDESVFRQHPPALVELFLLVSTHPKCDGVTASTIRLVREHLYLVDDKFRSNEEVTSLFMQLMSAPSGMTHQMRRMNSYGFLAAYIPAFGKITGRMQYDLFHAYTVDQHTIFVIRNLRRFALDKHEDEFPFCNEVYRELENPALLYLAALFHDIAKGRDGDHSVLGSDDAMQFCLQHNMNRKDTRVVSQLVRNHLVMSVTAQRKDISDPDVVRDFAKQVGSVGMLNYLYLLTVADIRSTNPKLWNNWKDSLLKQLYKATKQVIRRGIDIAPDIDEVIRENRDAAFEEMQDLEFSLSDITSLCDQLPGDYFLRHQPLEIRWHIKTILDNPKADILVNIRQARHTKTTKVFVYCDEHPFVFSQVTGVLGALGLTILNAEIFTTDNNKVMDTFIIQDQNNEAITDRTTIRHIESELIKALDSKSMYKSATQKRLSRQLKAFNRPTEIIFEQDYLNSRTVMQISAMDRPGLLSVIANVIATMDINITHAKITTLGEKIDDIFYLTTPEGKNIVDTSTLEELENRMTEALLSRKAA